MQIFKRIQRFFQKTVEHKLELDSAIDMLLPLIKANPERVHTLLVGSPMGKHLYGQQIIRIALPKESVMQTSSLHYITSRLNEQGYDIKVLHGSSFHTEIEIGKLKG